MPCIPGFFDVNLFDEAEADGEMPSPPREAKDVVSGPDLSYPALKEEDQSRDH